MPVRLMPFDAETINHANFVTVPEDVPACACGANGGVWVSRSKGASWLPARSSGTVADLYSCIVADDLHGWAVGERGVIIATSDGGVRWTKQESPTTEELCEMSFADALHGTVTSERGTTLRTSDGGETWVLDE